MKTLIGKQNYLFLINDTCKELEVHNDNLCLVNTNFKEYNLKNTLLIVFPNKSFLYSNFLPDGYDLKYRSGFNAYKSFFKDHIIDGYELLKTIDDTYYKTDTHINNKGSLIIYNSFINKIRLLFNLYIPHNIYSIQKQNVDALSNLGLGIGDLTFASNLGTQKLETMEDTYYTINECPHLYMNYIGETIRLLLNENGTLIDDTNKNIGTLLDWNKISKYILFKKNPHLKYKVVIFYDSFLCSTLQLYMELFYEIYCIKNMYNSALIKIINPDYVFEFRVERFLV